MRRVMEMDENELTDAFADAEPGDTVVYYSRPSPRETPGVSALAWRLGTTGNFLTQRKCPDGYEYRVTKAMAGGLQPGSGSRG